MSDLTDRLTASLPAYESSSHLVVAKGVVR